jgi:cation transport regulator ChaC
MSGRDPQDEVDVPQKWIDKADQQIQDRIETSVDEERYASGDMVDEIYELAGELWAQDVEDEKHRRAEHEIEQRKERERMEALS